MAFEELKERAADAEREFRQYTEATIAYYKLRAFRLVMKSLLYLTKGIVLGFVLLLVLIFGSVAGAFALGEAFDSVALGFLVISGGYLLLFLLVYLLRDSMNAPLLRKFSEYFYEDE
ncbi:competence protein [Robiginitalea sp. SC105]|uniref:competence protein n=1 Tax=Robiginitalea sp. SC105 TaxID=2762332 RepID=UPI00163A5FAE|nr:competence protein [Robiginitalea sp. SC105]MBC2838205.1 competence protein [Robiginitalea sp. SC105]